MAAETITFRIDDQEYEVPDIVDLDMDEWQVMYEYTGLVLEDFAPIEDDKKAEAERIRRLRQPAFTKALLHIGYQRVHPDAEPEQIKSITGAAKLTRVLEALADATSEEEDGDADPPASTTTPGPSSPPSSDDSTESGSPPSEESSDQPGDDLAPTGTTG